MNKSFTPKNSGILPMIATTGSPTREEIRKFLEMYKAVGIQQFLFFGRAGCEFEYLSERWFEMCADLIEQAEELDMCVWLYDDYNCPTTIVNGKLPALGPDYQTKYIDIYLDDGKFICKRMTNPSTGDILSEKAMDYFISSTYDAYAVRFSKYFGTTVRGIFTDEPTQAFGSVGRNNKDGHLRFPSYDGIDDDYMELTGHCLENDFEACIRNYKLQHVSDIVKCDINTDKTGEINDSAILDIINNNPGYAPDNEPEILWPAYWRLIGLRMRKYYMDRLGKWCDEHKLYLTGHLYDEHASEQAVFRNGDPILALKGYTFPGMDEVYTGTDIKTAEWVTLGMVQNAVLYRGVGGLAEILSLGPCDMPPSKVRQMIWLTAMFNIDNYLIAVAQLNAKGNVTRGSFYGPCNPLQPYFGMYRLLAEDAQKAVEIAHKESEYSISVRFPQTLSAKRAVYHIGKHVYDDMNEFRLLLSELTDMQFAWRLIGEDDACGNEAVIEVTDNGYILNESFYKLDELLQKLDMIITRKAFVTSVDGKLCGNLYVKTCTDGTIVILDLNQDEKDRDYMLRINMPSLYGHASDGQKTERFTLAGRGVKIISCAINDEITQKNHIYNSKNKTALKSEEKIDMNWSVSYDSSNILRCDLSKNKKEFTFVCEDKIDACKLLVRQHGDIPSIMLDGVDVCACIPCNSLPAGFAELYLESSEFVLDAGKHVLTLKNDCAEYPYLAGVYICGDISGYKNNIIKNGMPLFEYGSMTDYGLINYVGKIVLESDVFIPGGYEIKSEHGVKLKIDAFSHFTEVYVDEEYLGGCAWPPYEWIVPDEKLGQNIKLKVVLSSSFGPMFGKIDELNGITESLRIGNRLIPGEFRDIGLVKLLRSGSQMEDELPLTKEIN